MEFYLPKAHGPSESCRRCWVNGGLYNGSRLAIASPPIPVRSLNNSQDEVGNVGEREREKVCRSPSLTGKDKCREEMPCFAIYITTT